MNWNWTLAGKIALFVNLALSLVFACWGIAIYSNHINTTEKKIGEREGEAAKRTKLLKDLQDQRSLGESRLAAASASLLDEEQKRPKLQQWYGQQLDYLRKGDGAIRDLPITIGKDGLPQLAGAELPGFASLQKLTALYAQRQKSVRDTVQETEVLVKKEKERSDIIGDGKEKGLLFDKAQLEAAKQKAVDEQDYLEPLLYNRQVEVQILTDRQQALQTRLSELKAVSVNKKP